MEELFAHRLEEAGGGWAARSWVWARAVADVTATAVRERARRWISREEAGMGTMTQDLRYGARSLMRTPLFTLAALATLALGIGAATATFSVVHPVLLEDLPYEDADRLVLVWPEVNANKAMALLAQDMESLERVSGISEWTLTVVGAGDPREITGTLVSTHHFELLGARPALGRTFRPEEELPGNAGVAVLSHDFWVSAFGADPEVVGRTVEIAGAEYDRRTVVGVMPRSYRPLVGETDLWIPLEGDPAAGLEEDDSWYVNHRVARLAPGATLERANQEVRAHARDVQARIPRILEEEEATTASVQPLDEWVAGETARVLWAALGAASLVLLIACANLTNLLLARGEARMLDLSVRSALGAGRSRVARMLLGESALLGVVGGALGVALAYGLVEAVVRQAPADFPRIDEVAVSGAVLAYALAVTVGATLLAGLLPALRASRVEATAALGRASRGTARGRARTSQLLVGAQVALAVVVVVGSGLMLRSLDNLVREDPGMDGSGVLTFRPNPPQSRYADGAAFGAYYDRVLERVAALPEVESVGAIHLLPGTDGTWSFPTYPEGVELPEGTAIPSINFRAVRPEYFRTVRIPLVAGRLPTAADGMDAEPVVVVNQAFVERFWPDSDPVGRTVSIFSPTGDLHRVVGVVGDVRQHGRAREARPELYYPHAQVPWDGVSLWIMARVRTGAPLDHAEAVRQAVWEVDPQVPIAGMDDMSAVLGRSTRTTRFLALLLGAFGALALTLGAIGVFGVTAYTVGRRVPEFGVRIALGASRGGVLRTALLQGLAPVAAGLAVGLACAALTTGVLESVLYQVPATDPATFAAVAGVLGAAALLAMLVPAWRASGVDPVEVLNGE